MVVWGLVAAATTLVASPPEAVAPARTELGQLVDALAEQQALGDPRRTGNYLIVVAQAFDNTAPLNQLMAGKTGQGLTVTKYVVPPGTTKETIQTYIRSLWGGPNAPDFVLVVGDTPAVPAWTGRGSKQAITDLYYACMGAGDDWYPEFPVGRFAVATVAELQAVVDKTLFVEAGLFSNPDYVKRGAFLANPDTNGMAEPTHDWVINNYFTPRGYTGIRIYASQGGGTQDVINAINTGALWVVYMGHSGSTGWWNPAFDQNHVRNLLNTGLYGLVFGFSCNTARFDSAECFGETWIRVANKGAAAYLSASNFIYWGSPEAWLPSCILEKAFYRSFFELGIWEVGPAWNAALYYFLNEYGRPEYPGGPPTQNYDIVRNFFELFVLLGDPSLLLPQPRGFTLASTPESHQVCVPPTTQVTYVIDVARTGNFDEVVTLNVSGAPLGATVGFSANGQVPPFSSVLTVGGLSSVMAGQYTLVVTGTSATMQRTLNVGLGIAAGAPPAVTLLTPPNGATNVPRTPAFTWTAAAGASSYELQVARDSGFTQIVHSVSVSGTSHTPGYNLAAGTLHFWRVRARNGCGVSPYSPTFSFTTRAQADYFTELFDAGGAFDLDNTTRWFIPDGSASYYRMCGGPLAALPTDPSGGTTLTLSDDSFATIALSGASVRLYGVNYTTFYVGSNGYITFNSGDSTYTESLEAHFNRPRISALFDDLNPATGGSVSWKRLGDRVAVTWLNVPEFGTSNQNTFQIEMFFDGRLRVSWLAIAANDGLAGLSAGGGVPADFLETDISAAGPCWSLGDLNCDGAVNTYDIDPFVLALTNPAGYAAQYPQCDRGLADCNRDGAINTFDVDAFVNLLGGG